MPFKARRSLQCKVLIHMLMISQGRGAGKLSISHEDLRQSDKYDGEVPEKDLAHGNHSSVHSMVVLVFPSL